MAFKKKKKTATAGIISKTDPISDSLSGKPKKRKIPRKTTNILSAKAKEIAHSIIRYDENPSFIKPLGDPIAATWAGIDCPTGCGCQLRTDGKVYYCSFVKCDYIERVEDFQHSGGRK